MANQTLLTVPLTNEPGTLSALTKVLTHERIDIEAIECVSYGEFGLVRICASDPQKAERVLVAKGYPVTTSEFLEAEILNQPGSLQKVLDGLAKSNVNVEGLWSSPTESDSDRIVLRVDDPVAARRVLAPYTPQTMMH